MGILRQVGNTRLTDGFNEVSLFLDDDGEVFLVRVTKYRPDRLNMIGNFSDQETLHIPLITKFGDLITGVGRRIWQIIKDEGRLNWREVLDRTKTLEVSEGLCCTNPMRDSSCESSVVAGLHEQTHISRLQDQELARIQ